MYGPIASILTEEHKFEHKIFKPPGSRKYDIKMDSYDLECNTEVVYRLEL